MNTIDLTTISIDDLDQIHDLDTLSAWTKGCTACSLRQESYQVTHRDGSNESPILLVGMNPGFCEDGTGIPFTGRAELQRSRCVSCQHYTTCYDWQTGLGSPRKRVDECLGHTPLPPGTPDHQVNTIPLLNGFPLNGIISAGQLLDNVLVSLGIDRSKIFLTNIALCKARTGNPKPAHVLSCSRIRLRTQRLLKPKVIVALGLMAIGEYSPRKLSLFKDHGMAFPYTDQDQTYQVVPTYHPSAILRKMMEFPNVSLGDRARAITDINNWKWSLYQDLGTAINLLDRAEIASLLLPGTKLTAGKLSVRTQT